MYVCVCICGEREKGRGGELLMVMIRIYTEAVLQYDVVLRRWLDKSHTHYLWERYPLHSLALFLLSPHPSSFSPLPPLFPFLPPLFELTTLATHIIPVNPPVIPRENHHSTDYRHMMTMTAMTMMTMMTAITMMTAMMMIVMMMMITATAMMMMTARTAYPLKIGSPG